MSTYPVSGERTPEHELQWIPNLFRTCIPLTPAYKPLSLTCISQQVIGPSTHKRYERRREHFFLSFFSSLSFSPSPSPPIPAINMGGPSPLVWVEGKGEKSVRGEGSLSFSPLVPTINLGGPSPLVWVAGTRRGGGRKGGRFKRGREPFLCSLSLPFRLLPHKLHSANIDSSWITHKHYEMFDWHKLP